MKKATGILIIAFFLIGVGFAFAESTGVLIMEQPSNLVLTDKMVLSWDVDQNVERYFYQANLYDGDTYLDHEFGSIYSWNVESNVASYDFSSKVISKMIALGLTDKEISVCMKLKSYGTTEYNGQTYTVESSDSDYTEKVIFRLDAEIKKMEQPSNLVLTDKMVLSWDADPNVERYFYQANLYDGNTYLDHEFGSTYSWNVESNVASYEFSSKVISKMIALGLTDKEISVCMKLKSYGTTEYNGQTYTVESPDSDYTDKVIVKFEGEILKLAKPSNLVLSDNMVLSWDADPNVERYFYQANLYDGNTYLDHEFGSIYSWNVVGNVASYDFSEKIESKIISLGLINKNLKVTMRLIGYGRTVYNSEVYTVDSPDSGYTEGTTYYVLDLSRFSVLNLPRNLKTIEDEAFASLSCEAIIIPDGCTTIGERAFENCKSLRYIVIPLTVTNIEESAFIGCDNVTIFWK